MAAKIVSTHTGKSGGTHTEAIPEEGTCGNQVILQLVVQEAENRDNDVEENEDTEEDLASTLVNHPDVHPLPPALDLGHGRRACSSRALDTLQTPALGLVALQMAGLIGRVRVRHVDMLVEVRRSTSVREIEPRKILVEDLRHLCTRVRRERSASG